MRCTALTLFSACLGFLLPALAAAADDCPDGDWFCEPAPPAGSPGTGEAPADSVAAPNDPTDLERAPPPERVLIDVENVKPLQRRKHRRFREWGVGLHGIGGLMGGDEAMAGDADMNGFGGALRFRPIPHLAIEGAIELVWGTDYNGFQRFEDALLLSALLFVNPRSPVQIYALGGFGVGAAFLELEGGRADDQFRDDTYTYAGVQLGAGLEGRITKHFAVGADVIGFVRRRTDRFARDNPEFIDPESRRSSNVSGGGLLRAGVTFYW